MDSDTYGTVALPETKIKEIFDKINNDFLIPKSSQKMMIRNINYLPRNKKPITPYFGEGSSYPTFYFSQPVFKDKNIPEVIVTFSKWTSGSLGTIQEIAGYWFPVDYFSFYAADYITLEIKEEATKTKLKNFCNKFPPLGSKIAGAPAAEPQKLITFITYSWGVSSEKFKVFPDSEFYYKDQTSFAAAMITRGLK